MRPTANGENFPAMSPYNPSGRICPLHCFLVLGILQASSVKNTRADTFLSFQDFSDLSPFQLNGFAATVGNPVTDDFGRQVLRLTDSFQQAGSAFYAMPLSFLKDGSPLSFSSHFSFRISSPLGDSDPDGVGADGIVFVIQPGASTALGGSGGSLGFWGMANSIGIEFDTWLNREADDDADGNHIGININGTTASVVAAPVPIRMNNGDDWFSWIDYDQATTLLEVRIATVPIKPSIPHVALPLDLPTLLGTSEAFIGFTSGTGDGAGYHDIVAWEFRVIPEASSWLAGMTFALLAANRIIRRLRSAPPSR